MSNVSLLTSPPELPEPAKALSAKLDAAALEPYSATNLPADFTLELTELP